MSVWTLEELRKATEDLAPRFYVYDEAALARRVRKRVSMAPHIAYLRQFQHFLQGFRTRNADEADYFFVPLCLICFQFANLYGHRITQPPPDPFLVIGQLPHLARGHHVLLATGDFGQRKRSPWEFRGEGRAYPHPYVWLDDRFSLLAFESTAELASQDVGVLPYALHTSKSTSFRLARRFSRVSTDRDLLYSFAGAMSYEQLPDNHIRGGRLKSISGRSADSFVGTQREARSHYGRAGSDQAVIRRSTFTICPAGFGRWTFRLGQALALGSIPVLVADGYRLPHSRFISWDECLLRVPEAQLESVPELLRAMAPAEIRALQEGLRGQAHLFSREAVLRMTLLDLTHVGGKRI